MISGAATDRAGNRILQITAMPFPPEIRVVKEGLSLLEAGYQCAVLCPPIKGRPAKEHWQGISVFRPEVMHEARTAIDRVRYQSMFFSYGWYRAIQQVIAEYRPDVLHVHDIWLGRTVLRATTTQRIVMDLHENMPAAVVEYQAGYRGWFKWFNAAFKSYGRILRYERRLLERSDRVLVVVQEAKDRVHEVHPRLAPDKVVNVENLESRRFIAVQPSTVQRVVERNSVLYIGGFGPHRGIDTLVEAMHHAKRLNIDAHVYLVGARKSTFLDSIYELIRRLEVSDRVHVIEWVPAEQVLAYIQQSAICAVPHHSNPHTDTTIPHKLFQYMIARKPVLVSTSRPLARTVGAADAGMIFEAGDGEDCARKIQSMLRSAQALNVWGENGRRYVLEAGHNWEEESAPRLIAAYDDLLACAPHAPSIVRGGSAP